MKEPRPDPVRPADAESRATARRLLTGARHAALGVIGPDGGPMVSRIAIATDPAGLPLACLSSLSAHTQALRADPRASLLLGEPGAKGDPLTHPRLTLQCRADWVAGAPPGALALLRTRWLAHHPRAGIYLGLPDFRFLRLVPVAGFLNGGFGRAYRLTPEDLLSSREDTPGTDEA